MNQGDKLLIPHRRVGRKEQLVFTSPSPVHRERYINAAKKEFKD